jgi:leader peptidase (prepilin peptidase)/N-methyltransferase
VKVSPVYRFSVEKTNSFDRFGGSYYTVGSMDILFFFVFGIIIGSFLNVVIYRLKEGQTLMGRSACRSCHTFIAWYDNVPLLSFLWLRAKCRLCQNAIAWQYPLVEFGTGILFALVGNFFWSIDEIWVSLVSTLFFLVLFSIFVVIFVYDLTTLFIPMLLVWIGIGWVVAFEILTVWLLGVRSFGAFVSSIGPFLLAGAGAAFVFWFLAWYSDESWMGMGDVYLVFLIGLVVGWPAILWCITIASGLGAGIGLLLIVRGKKNMKSQVPFAPFLIAGAFLVILLPKIFPVLRMFFISNSLL